MSQSAASVASQKNTRVALWSAALAVFMVAASYASVPLYRLFCQVTGFGGTTQKAEKAPDHIAAQVIKVRFDANVAPGLSWSFEPKDRVQTLKIGQQGFASYRAVNNSNKTITGTATFNVTPDIVGQYFNKIQCFCFTEQTLKPGESKEMPVIYFVDPAILDDPHARKIDEITLSYTFYKVDKPAAQRQQVAVTRTTASGVQSLPVRN